MALDFWKPVGTLLGYEPTYSRALAQAQRSAEQQLAYMKNLAGADPASFFGVLMGQYKPRIPENPIPWETRYADFCERLTKRANS